MSRGGKRPGAGRKKGSPKVPVSITVLPETLRAWNRRAFRARGEGGKSGVARGVILDRYFLRGKIPLCHD